jgi:hypothetical protein
MSLSNSFADVFRQKLVDEIEKEKTNLVSLTNDRRAGLIQGMMNALTLANTVYQQLNTERVPAERKPNQQF